MKRLVLGVRAGGGADDARRSGAGLRPHQLDLYLEYETVSDPQISPDGSQIIYTRGWVDKQADRRETSLWVMNADGSKNRFLVRGSSARWSPTGDRIAYTAQGEPRGTQIFVRYMDAEGAASQITRVEKAPTAIAWSPDGTRIGFMMNVEAKNRLADQDAARAGGRQVGGDAAHRRAPRLPLRRHRLRRRCLPPHLRGAGDGRHAAPADRRQLEPQRRRVDARQQADPVHRRLRAADAEYQWRDSDIYAVTVRHRRHQAAHHAQGTRRQSAGVARRQARRLHRATTGRRTPGRTASSMS